MKKTLILVAIVACWMVSRSTLANLGVFYAYSHQYKAMYICQLLNHPIQKLNNILVFRIPGHPFPCPKPGRPFPKRG